MKPYRPRTDPGLLIVLLALAAIGAAALVGALDCRLEALAVGFC